MPHAVLSGLFGRPPQPFLFPNWVLELPEINSEDYVHVGIGFAMVNGGPGIARELYANVKILHPKGKSKLLYKELDPPNWTSRKALGHMINIISKDGYRLAPGAVAEPFSIELYFHPPFESELVYEIAFGHQNWPMRKLMATIEPAKIASAYTLFLAGRGQPTEATQKVFLEEVFPFKDGGEHMSQEEYEAWLRGSEPS